MGFQRSDDRFGGRPREMFKAICAECKQECEVPFRPSGDRPVYCKECFSKRKDSRG
ncbi:MAG: DNA-directed RNA polymerase [Candidatus Omnitrophica bacterium]|nr:DNA-directed RNA polymerase [Candidatus Omnitrophota bacterium]